MLNVLKNKKVPHGSVILHGIISATLSLLVGGCAGQVAPSGGPLDLIPPSIIRTEPDSNATRVMPEQIELEFGEYVERRTVEEAVFISPYAGKLEFDWSGKEVTIRFPETLRKNTTYVLTVGTDVTDIRAGNRMAHAYSLAFSTGDSIDRGAVRGRVFDEKPDGIMIFAYNLNGLLPDTLDPTHTRPHYIVQTGSDGTFVLNNVAMGTYRVIAVRDEYRNLVYDREIDQFGVATGDPVLTESIPEFHGLSFRMSREDTTRPFLASVAAVNQRRLLVRFSEPVDTLAFHRAVFVLTDTTAKKALATGAQYQDMGNQTLVHLETAEPLDSMGTYRLAAREIVDVAGNRLDTTNASATFNGPSIPDTVKPYPSVRGVTDSIRGVAAGRTFEVDFARPVDLGCIMRGITLSDSSGQTVTIEVRPRTAAEVFVAPLTALKPFTWYTLRISLDSLRDSRGVHFHDSTIALHFQTADSRALGTIEGKLDGTLGEHGAVISARTVDAIPPRNHVVRVKAPGRFLIDQLPEGRYGIEAFEDCDQDGRFRSGLPFPFVPSARFTTYPDTVRVRARWSVEGVQLRLK